MVAHQGVTTAFAKSRPDHIGHGPVMADKVQVHCGNVINRR